MRERETNCERCENEKVLGSQKAHQHAPSILKETIGSRFMNWCYKRA